MTNEHGMTVKELVLDVRATLNTYIDVHERRHQSESDVSAAARSDPSSSAAGRVLQREISTVTANVTTLSTTVGSHERTLQRIIGGMVLISALGIGTLILVFLRISGVVG